jgi:hypothetical protein
MRLVGSADQKLGFPAPLDAGFYLAELRSTAPGGTAPRQVRLQVTDISWFLSLTPTRMLIWAHDLRTQAPLQQGELELPSGRVAIGPDGLALAAAPGGRAAVRIRSPGKEAVVLVPGPTERSPAMAGDRYLRYLHVDRAAYRPDDTLRFWGVIRPRGADVPAPGRIGIVLDRESRSPIATTVPVTGGVFSG